MHEEKNTGDKDKIEDNFVCKLKVEKSYVDSSIYDAKQYKLIKNFTNKCEFSHFLFYFC